MKAKKMLAELNSGAKFTCEALGEKCELRKMYDGRGYELFVPIAFAAVAEAAEVGVGDRIYFFNKTQLAFMITASEWKQKETICPICGQLIAEHKKTPFGPICPKARRTTA